MLTLLVRRDLYAIAVVLGSFYGAGAGSGSTGKVGAKSEFGDRRIDFFVKDPRGKSPPGR